LIGLVFIIKLTVIKPTRFEEESTHIQPAPCFGRSAAGWQVSSKVLIALGIINTVKWTYDALPQIPPNWTTLDPSVTQTEQVDSQLGFTFKSQHERVP